MSLGLSWLAQLGLQRGCWNLSPGVSMDSPLDSPARCYPLDQGLSMGEGAGDSPPPPGDLWQGPETFLMVTSWGGRVCEWHPGG